MLPGIISAGVIPIYDPPGTQTFNSSGTFTVPRFAGTLTITLWGAGGGGAGIASFGATNGSDGGLSRVTGTGFSTLTANGGSAPDVRDEGGSGGTASGGDTNTTGGSGEDSGNGSPGGDGGDSPNGGTGGNGTSNVGNGDDGNAPGGGGAGGYTTFFGVPIGAAGGGAGGYCRKSYTQATLPADRVLTITVGTGGSGGDGDVVDGGDGANGRVEITWT